MTSKIRVAVVDDSDIAAAFVRDHLEAAPDIDVVATAPGVDALMRTGAHREVDVVVLDLWMPGRSGLGAISELSRVTTVIVVSDEAATSALAKEALAQGARAFVAKRDLATPEGKRRLRMLVRGASADSGGPRVLCVVGSTGMNKPLEELVISLRDRNDLAWLVLQHLPPGREVSLAERLSQLGLPARPATDGASIEYGRALVAPAGQHMTISGERVRLTRDAPIDGLRPAATVLLRSAVTLGPRACVVVLSGMGRDGADAIPNLVAAGSACFAQAPETCTAESMPRAALDASPAVRNVPAGLLARRIARHLEAT